MRFSAPTANSHRIHYDWPYATFVEGYPGLVVHRPLQTLALAEIHRLTAGAPVMTLRHRVRAPLSCGEPARLHTTARSDGVSVELRGRRSSSPELNATLDLITT
jgi:3-methylfumaryl-CoA hydratase